MIFKRKFKFFADFPSFFPFPRTAQIFTQIKYYSLIIENHGIKVFGQEIVDNLNF